MPKVPTSFPLSGLFAVAKPSGPTSMSVVNDIKALVTNSRLFVEESKLKSLDKGKRKKGRFSRDTVKIGQGGTLDPLADGVLGIVHTSVSPELYLIQKFHSNWHWEGHEEIKRIPRLRQGCSCDMPFDTPHS